MDADLETCFDVAIVGGGVMGSATAFYLARNGLRTVMLEMSTLGGHSGGSSHGGSRITRRTDANEHMARMATRGLEEWAALEHELGGRELLRRCGSLDFGDPLQPSFREILDQTRGQPGFTFMTADAISRRWPAFSGLPEHWVGVFNAEGGILTPDVVVPALQMLAQAAGAKLYGSSKVELVRFPAERQADCEAHVVLATGSRIRARRVVMAAGPWTTELVSRSFGLAIPLDIWEVSFGWYKLNREHAAAQQHAAELPVWRAFGGVSRCYGFPLHERQDALKVAPHGHADFDVHQEPGCRTGVPNPRYIEDTSAFAASLFEETLQRGPGGVELEQQTCLYSVTRDGSFVIDWVPEAFAPRGTVVVLAGFCGSGFKHGPLIGRLVAEMMLGASVGDTERMRRPASFPDLEPFSLRRASRTTSTSSRLLAEHAIASRARL